MKVHFSKQFFRIYRKLPSNLKNDFENAVFKFEQDIFDNSLRTHKLKSFVGLWSFRINFSHRVIFRFVKKNEIELITIGDHSIYKNL